MPDEHDFRDFKSIEDYGETLEGSKYYHSLYLKAVNHPVRREILEIVNKTIKISKNDLLVKLIEKGIIESMPILEYNVDFLIKALCIEEIEENEEKFYYITQAGKVIEYLK